MNAKMAATMSKKMDRFPGKKDNPGNDHGDDDGPNGDQLDDFQEQLGGKVGALKAAMAKVHDKDYKGAARILSDLKERIEKAIEDLGGAPEKSNPSKGRPPPFRQDATGEPIRHPMD